MQLHMAEVMTSPETGWEGWTSPPGQMHKKGNYWNWLWWALQASTPYCCITDIPPNQNCRSQLGPELLKLLLCQSYRLKQMLFWKRCEIENKNEFHISKRSLHIIDIGVMNKSLQNISLPVIFSNLGIFIYFLGIFP